MARTEAPLKLSMITQQLDPKMWELYPADVIALVKAAFEEPDDDPNVMRSHARLVGSVILRQLDELWPVGLMYAIIHDKDTHEVWDEISGELVTCAKVRHIHVLVRFESKGGTVRELADAVKFPPAHIEKPQPGRYAFDNMLAYLIHAKDADKFAYDPFQVATIKGRSYSAIAVEQAESWKRGRAAKTARAATSEEAVESVVERCLTGELRMSQIMLDNQLFAIYARNRTKIDEALDTFGQRRMWRAAEALKRGEFKTQVYFVTGPPRSGKSWFAEQLIEKNIKDAPDGERWEMYRAAPTNPLDGYRGEEIILMDDLRPGAMDASNWLNLLDPHRPSASSARYRNKENVAPRVIVITSYLDPVDFFFFVKSRGGLDEAMNQFIDRLRAILHVLPAAEMTGALQYAVDIVGQRKPYVRGVQMADGSMKEVRLEYGMIARGLTEDKDQMIDFLVQGVLRSGHSTVFEIESSSSSLDIIDAEVIEEAEAEAARVAAAELFERRERSQREWNEQHGIPNMPFATN